jgi:hypothetical protein
MSYIITSWKKGSPNEQANVLRNIKAAIKELLTTQELDAECENYLYVLARR